MRWRKSNRLDKLPPYLFAEIEKIITQKRKEGKDLISFGVGDPDVPPPKFILESLAREALNPKNHNYSFSQGEEEFKRAVAEWYKKRFNVDLNPETEVTALIGSKEGLANISRAFLNPGEKVLVPDPAYPVYLNGATLLNDNIPVFMPLLEENNFLPKLNKLNVENVKMMFLNYPNNPTGAVINKEKLEEVVEFAKENNLIICYDNAYSELTFDDYKAPSILQVGDSKEYAIEFHSCSKTFSMTGDRIGFAVGNAELIEGLVKVKSQIDSGPQVYIQKAAVKALESYTSNQPPPYIKERNEIYRKRRDYLVEELNAMGLKCYKPKGTFYIWAKCFGKSIDFVKKLLEVNVVTTPGVGFGKYGESYIRFALTIPLERIKEACERVRKIL
ncbi:aminotransferase class I/II-fold pyridoxal phosphate-dependent enzyme [Candidatus Bathyarchaeota archaeon]|nr:aminotransferase class I/II-fold pyridoxal phosphate-dependent enzyme [Candidatus Bathyarchaeota archaeon]